jgi:hypothetical protein
MKFDSGEQFTRFCYDPDGFYQGGSPMLGSSGLAGAHREVRENN